MTKETYKVGYAAMPRVASSMTRQEIMDVLRGIHTLMDVVHRQEARNGWVNSEEPRNIPTQLMLIVSEVSEAMEADRKALMDDKLPHHSGLTVELAAALIRIAGLAAEYGMPLGVATVEKIEFNQNRADHKPENRAKQGGKRY